MTLYALADLICAGLVGVAVGAGAAEWLRWRAGWRAPQPRTKNGRFR